MSIVINYTWFEDNAEGHAEWEAFLQMSEFNRKANILMEVGMAAETCQELDDLINHIDFEYAEYQIIEMPTRCDIADSKVYYLGYNMHKAQHQYLQQIAPTR